MSKILKNSSPGDLNGFLDAGCEVQGDLRFQNTFRIHGRFSGTVESEGELVVGEGGVVEGVVKVGELSVSGRLEGEVEASNRVEIGANGHVEGSISTPRLVIESGAFFQGQCRMGQEEAAPAARPSLVGGGRSEAVADDADPALERFALPGGGDGSSVEGAGDSAEG